MSFEAMIEIFTDLSLRRRNGVLQVKDPERLVEIGFADGKIVKVESSTHRNPSSLVQRLKAAGVISTEVFELLRRANISLRDFGELLISKNIVSAQQYQRFKKVEDLDLLYALRHSYTPELKFISKHISPRENRRFEAQYDIAPTQILLDMAELFAEDEKFKQLFPSDSLLISQADKPPRGLSASELELWDSLVQETELAKLSGGAFSEHELKQGLFSLLELGLINISSETELSEEDPEASQKETPALPAEFADLELSLRASSPAEKIKSEISQSVLTPAAKRKESIEAALRSNNFLEQNVPLMPAVSAGKKEEASPLVLGMIGKGLRATETAPHKWLMWLLCFSLLLACLLPFGAFASLFAAINEITVSAESSMLK